MWASTLHHSILATEGESTDERGVHHEWRVDKYDVVGALVIVVKTLDDALEYPDDPCSGLEQPCHEVFDLIHVSIHTYGTEIFAVLPLHKS